MPARPLSQRFVFRGLITEPFFLSIPEPLSVRPFFVISTLPR